MQIELLILMACVMAFDHLAPSGAAGDDSSTQALLWVAPYAAFVVVSWLMVRRLLRVVVSSPQRIGPALRRYNRFTHAAHAAALAYTLWLMYAAGGLAWVRRIMGDWVALDELVFASPFLCSILLEWWLFYAVDARLRLEPAGTRWHYLKEQVRQQWLLAGVPMALMLVLTQSLDRLTAWYPASSGWWSAVNALGFAAVLLLTPAFIRHLWRTEPLPKGPLRATLMALCRKNRVNIRELLVWHTYGGVVNGAAMGLVGPLRYILLTDGLLGRLDERQVEGVMAHEVAHVKLHHIPWMMLCAVTAAFTMETGISIALQWIEPWVSHATDGPGRMESVVWLVGPLALTLLGWWVVFGWVSRRFERQADTFAVRHLSAVLADEPGATIGGEAVEVYTSGLLSVAEINRTPTTKRSWRHGSIQWRVDYLRTLVGSPANTHPIDQRVRTICLAAAFIAALLLLYHVGLPL